MGWTKREYIEQAFEEIGLASYVFDLTPEQLQSALRKLDAMLAEWNAKGLRLGLSTAQFPKRQQARRADVCAGSSERSDIH